MIPWLNGTGKLTSPHTAPNDALEPQGVGVIIKASHHCMTTRGVHKPDTDLVTSRMLGCFRDNALTRQEFLGMAT